GGSRSRSSAGPSYRGRGGGRPREGRAAASPSCLSPPSASRKADILTTGEAKMGAGAAPPVESPGVGRSTEPLGPGGAPPAAPAEAGQWDAPGHRQGGRGRGGRGGGCARGQGGDRPRRRSVRP